MAKIGKEIEVWNLESEVKTNPNPKPPKLQTTTYKPKTTDFRLLIPDFSLWNVFLQLSSPLNYGRHLHSYSFL